MIISTEKTSVRMNRHVIYCKRCGSELVETQLRYLLPKQAFCYCDEYEYPLKYELQEITENKKTPY